MTLPYLVRLVCLSLACFCAVNLAATFAVRAFSQRMIRRAASMDSRRAALTLLFWRLFPAAFALACVIGLCVPSYLWFEPHAANEGIGVACITGATIGAAMFVVSLSRGVRAGAQSLRYSLPRVGRVVALVGILKPRVIISADVAAVLTAGELDAALRHENAHRASHDNLKHLLILLSPGFLLQDVERAWKQFCEWAADDHAVAGDPNRAADLASALVAVARLRPATMPVLSTTLLADDAVLSARVDRLLADRPATPERSRRFLILTLAAMAVVTPFMPVALAWVHQVLERLMD